MLPELLVCMEGSTAQTIPRLQVVGCELCSKIQEKTPSPTQFHVSNRVSGRV